MNEHTRPLSIGELAAAERIAEDALARCARVVANPGGQLTARAGGSCVPDLAEAVLRLAHEVKQLRGRRA